MIATVHKMTIPQIAFLFVTILMFADIGNANDPRDRILSRKKRYLVFPEGSSVSVSIYGVISVRSQKLWVDRF
jgi:hypothetical protein